MFIAWSNLEQRKHLGSPFGAKVHFCHEDETTTFCGISILQPHWGNSDYIPHAHNVGICKKCAKKFIPTSLDKVYI